MITLSSYPLHHYNENSYSVTFDVGVASPSKRVEIKTVADCKAALAAYAEEVKATGKPWKCSVLFDDRSGRKPAGFAKAKAARELEAFVNTHLAKRSSI
jgi:hypothetical protein